MEARRPRRRRGSAYCIPLFRPPGNRPLKPQVRVQAYRSRLFQDTHRVDTPIDPSSICPKVVSNLFVDPKVSVDTKYRGSPGFHVVSPCARAIDRSIASEVIDPPLCFSAIDPSPTGGVTGTPSTRPHPCPSPCSAALPSCTLYIRAHPTVSGSGSGSGSGLGSDHTGGRIVA